MNQDNKKICMDLMYFVWKREQTNTIYVNQAGTRDTK